MGVAYCDAELQHFGVAEFGDGPDQFPNLEALLVQVGAKECLIAQEKGNRALAKVTGPGDNKTRQL